MTRVGPRRHGWLRLLAGIAAGASLALGAARPPPARAAPPEPLVVGVVGWDADGGRLQAAAGGARLAAARYAPEGRDVLVEVVDDGGEEAPLRAGLRRLRGRDPIGVVAVPPGHLEEAYWKAVRSVRAPWLLVGSVGPDLVRNPGNAWHLAPSPATQAIRAADAVLAPLAARRVAVVHEPSPRGRRLAGVFLRNLSAAVAVAGVVEWPLDGGPSTIHGLQALEADRFYVALTGRYAVAFVRALDRSSRALPCLFADGSARSALRALAPEALAGSVFLGGPDPELEGRVGEHAVEDLEGGGLPVDDDALRAYEAVRWLLAVAAAADSTAARDLVRAMGEVDPGAGVAGPLPREEHRGPRFYPSTLWRVGGGGLEPWPPGLLPVPGCGPPLGFGRPPPGPLNRKGRLGYVHFAEGDLRTIEADLLGIGLSTGGREPDLDALLREEVLGRAIRIAHRLFRREADGTPIPGWSWGMTFTTEPPPEDLPFSRRWEARVAGDHPAAGGQVLGSNLVAVYSTFLKRTMYLSRRLDPPVGPADRPLLDGTYRWGEDRARNRRVDEIRCLLDGFASAVGLTLVHELGHLCGCGHDTEHPTSIMNVVAGAGASWEEAVWIPSHRRAVTSTLGIEEGTE